MQLKFMLAHNTIMDLEPFQEDDKLLKVSVWSILYSAQYIEIYTCPRRPVVYIGE